MIIYIVGTGTMGTAIAKTLKNNRAKTNGRIFLSDREPGKSARLAKLLGVSVDNNLKQIHQADLLFLCVKPQDFPALASKLPRLIAGKTIIISIAAGLTIKNIQKLFNHNKVVRAMPNLGLLVGQGITVWKTDQSLNGHDKNKIKSLLDVVCLNYEIKDESLIDDVTALSGSGPAYFFYLARAMEEKAVSLGIDKKKARLLIEKTFLAAACLQKGEDYSKLIKRVASRRGTTEAALNFFDKAGVNKIIKSGIDKAKTRARELKMR